MKRLMFIVCLLAFAVASDATAQQFYEDVVYLKDGSIIRGIIVEQIPNESLKMRLQGGSVMVFKMVNVLKITKDSPAPQNQMQTYQMPRKEPVVGCLLSFFIPGAGQIYNEQYGKGAFLFISYWVGFGMLVASLEQDFYGNWDLRHENLAIAGFFVMFSSFVFSVTDAIIESNAINKERQQQPRSHLIELERNQFTVGIDPITSPNQIGTMLSLRF